MSIFLPIAGFSVSLYFLVGIGAVVGFLSGLLGVGGGFLLTPILIMIGIPPTVAAASDSCQIVAASSSGVAAHFRLGNVDYRMGAILLIGGLSGAALGVEIIKVLRTLGDADFLIDVAYIVLLGSVGGSMLISSLSKLRRGHIVTDSGHRAKKISFLGRLPLQVDFPHSQVRHSAIVPLALSMLVGILAAIMGVGGGFLMLPMMVYLLGMPTHVAVGTSLFQILFTCVGVTYMQATTNFTVDVALALLLAAGSAIGAQIGARVVRFLRSEQLLIILAALALIVATNMTIAVMEKPGSLLELAEQARLEPGVNVFAAGMEPDRLHMPFSQRLKLPPGSGEFGSLSLFATQGPVSVSGWREQNIPNQAGCTKDQKIRSRRRPT